MSTFPRVPQYWPDHPDRLGSLFGELGGVEREHGEFRVRRSDFGGQLLLVDLLHALLVPGVVRDEALEIPDLSRPPQFEGDRLDALSPEIGEESQRIALGVVPGPEILEGGGEVLVEDRELSGQEGQVLVPQVLSLRKEVGRDMPGGREDDPVRGARRGSRNQGLPRFPGRRRRDGGGVFPRPSPLAGRRRGGLRKKASFNPELRVEDRDVKVLDLAVMDIAHPALFREALALAETEKSRRPVAGSRIMDGIHEALHQPGSEAEPVFPVAGKTAKGLPQNMGGEVFDPNPREDQEAGVVDQTGAVDLLFFRRPADPPVPDFELGSRARKRQGGHRLGPTRARYLIRRPGSFLYPRGWCSRIRASQHASSSDPGTTGQTETLPRSLSVPNYLVKSRNLSQVENANEKRNGLVCTKYS